MFVYWVCRTLPVHACDCQRFHSKHERVRVHSVGVWFDKAEAQRVCDNLNHARRRFSEPRFFVKGYKVKDAEKVVLTKTTIERIEPDNQHQPHVH